MAVNRKKRKPIPVNNGTHRIPVANEREWTRFNEKPFYGHKRERNMSIRQGDMVLATFTEWTKNGYMVHNHPAFVLSTSRSLTDTRKIWVLPFYLEASVGFNGEADVEIKMFECEGLKNDGHLAVNHFQCLPLGKVIKRIGHVNTNRVFDEVTEKLFGQIGISAQREMIGG